MAGTLDMLYSETRTVKKVAFDWLSDASGDVNGTHTKYLSGEILRIVFIPDSGGTQPTDLYDVTLEDDSGMDVLAGQGANLSNANTTNVEPGVPFKDGTTTSVSKMVIDDLLELKVSNAGNAKGGQVIVYVR